MKKKTEDLLLKELDEIEAFDFVTSFPHLLDKTSFIARDIQNDFPEESKQLYEITCAIEDLLKQAPPDQTNTNFTEIKGNVVLILKQILEIED